MRRARFAAEVRSRGEPFVIVCGFGETGGLICSALDRSGTRFVVVERDEARRHRRKVGPGAERMAALFGPDDLDPGPVAYL